MSRSVLAVDLPREVFDRLDFLGKVVGLADASEVVERAVKLLDRVVCGVVLEKGRLAIHGRDGTIEAVEISDA